MHRILAMALSLGALHAGAATPSDAAFSADWAPEDCALFKLRAAPEAALCGHVSVPLRHGDAHSPRIRLATVILPALDGARREGDPLLLAQGGPGGSTIGGFAQVLLDDATKRPTQNRDLVLWDQRGTYFSQPRLQCRESARLGADADEAAQREAMRRCGQRLTAEAHDLSAFNSQENARDADAVRAALGYDAFNFYGVSYGSELGQFLMRERPARLRAVVLDAVVPLGFSLVADVPQVKQRVMAQYASSCAESSACNAAYPHLGQRYLALLERLDRSPLQLPAAASGAASAALDGKRLDNALYQSLYAREAVPLIPYILHRAEQGDFSFALNFVGLMSSQQDEMADAMYLSVVCSEVGDTPAQALRFPGVLARLAKEARSDARQILEVCADWRIALLDKALLAPLRSDIPTLLLSGQFDPITPPAHAQRVAEGLSRATQVTFARGTHGQAFTQACANRLIADFLDRPGAALNTTCAQESQPVFFTPEQLLALPARQRSGSASLMDHVQALAGPALLVALTLALLLSAVPVYSISEVVRVFRSRSSVLPAGWRGRLIGAAPWLPVLTAGVLLAALAVAATRVAAELERNQMLLLVGVLPSSLRALAWLLVPYTAALALMSLALVLLWRHRARSLPGRLYYSLLTTAGWVVWAAFIVTGLFGFHGG